VIAILLGTTAGKRDARHRAALSLGEH
jgi:hypothetical protein